MYKLVIGAALLASVAVTQAQYISAGPVVGGVTNTDARIQIHFDTLGTYAVELCEDSNFNGIIKTYTGNPSAATYGTWMFDVKDLIPSTKYYYRVINHNTNQYDSRKGRFKTFPVPGTKGYYKIAIGSCNYFSNTPLFEHLKGFDPDLVMHLGDWDYPPSSPGMGAYYNLDTAKQAKSFAIRYEDPTFKPYILPYFPVTYTYDDDWGQNDSEGWTFPEEKVTLNPDGSATTQLITHNLPAGLREGAIHSWLKFFPGYPLNHDSADGIHHKFMLGNVEVFMTDNRITRKPRHDAFKLINGQYQFLPDTNHTLLGVNQRYWLVNNLKASTADWKLITSGVIFNMGYKRILDFAMLVQDIGFNLAGRQASGLYLANAMAYNWVGYPVDQNALLNLKGTVKDMVFVSGDSHSSAIDDGTNSGIPEMQSSGWNAGDEGYLFYYIDSISQSIGQPAIKDALWNAGGNGIENKNFSDTYGTVEIFEDDSLRMCVIDELGQQLGCLTILHSSKQLNAVSSLIKRKQTLMHLIYPNPTKDVIRILLNNNYAPEANDKVELVSINGSVVMSLLPTSGNMEIPVSKLSAGTYIVRLLSKQGREERRVVVY